MDEFGSPTSEEAQELTAQLKKLRALCVNARLVADKLKARYFLLEKDVNFDLYKSDAFWSAYIYREAMIKIANIIENDLVAITTFSVLTSARYLMEMLIWLRLIDRDPNQFISYFIALRNSEQLQDAKATLENTKRELDTYKMIAASQSEQLARLQRRTKRNVLKILDKSVPPAFSTFYSYERQARTKGFAKVAWFLETKIIAECNRNIEALTISREKAMSARKHWLNEKWLWNKRAKEADLELEYEFIYGYVSRLVHCKPASFATDEKNLEYHEVIMFVDFILFLVRDLINIAKRLRA